VTIELPPCGLYRTTAAIGPIPGGRLVFFHNHGNPGPGLYLPKSWKHNRVQLRTNGTLLPGVEFVKFLEPLPPEGFYRVAEPFFCCKKRCRRFEPDTLVQLGYNARAQAILFLPETVGGLLAIPERGVRIDGENLDRIKRLNVRTARRSKVIQ
jgi:hypothetical protein